jgi:hypothetical protein
MAGATSESVVALLATSAALLTSDDGAAIQTAADLAHDQAAEGVFADVRDVSNNVQFWRLEQYVSSDSAAGLSGVW